MPTTESLISIGVPLVTWLVMLIVGLDIQVADLRRIAEFPKTVLSAVAGQVVLIPAIGFLLVWLLTPTEFLVAGLILVAASPAGAISNYYTYLARANTALSVTLTAVSTLIALIKMPLVTTIGFSLLLNDGVNVAVPAQRIVLTLLVMLILPVTVGMGVRRLWPIAVERSSNLCRLIGNVAVAILVALILFQQRHNLSTQVLDIVSLAVLFSVCSMTVGWTIGWLAQVPIRDRFTLLIEFGARNLAIVTMVGVTTFAQIEYALFGAVFFVTQVPIILLLIGIYSRYQRSRRESVLE